MPRKIAVLGFVALLCAGQASAFPISIPGLKPKPKPAPAADAPTTPGAPPPTGVYIVEVGGTAIYFVDAATIAPNGSGRMTANVYVLNRTGEHRLDADDFDCQGHAVRKTGGTDFTLTSNRADVTMVKGIPWTKDHTDPDHSVIRIVEDFVCLWPAAAAHHVLVSDLPDDEHARMLKLATSAPEFFR